MAQEAGAWASGHGVEFETGQNRWIRCDSQFGEVFTARWSDTGFPYFARELIKGVRLSHNRKVQALGHVLFARLEKSAPG